MPQPIYSNAEIVRRLTHAQAIATRVSMMIMERARQASRDAGLGDIGCQLHNALVSAEWGKPWAEVDYSKARKAQWLINKSYEPARIVDAYYLRMVGLPPRRAAAVAA